MNKKVLLLGGAGYIGGITTDYLIENGYDVCVYDKLLYETRYLKNVPFIYGDIRDTKRIKEISENFDVIVITAAIVGDAACAVDVALTNSINQLVVKNICEQVNEKIHVIFLSTCSVYGAQNGLLNEESPVNPLSVYAKTKYAAEAYVNARGGTIFRLGTVYGVGDSYSRVRLDLVANVLTMKAVYEKQINIFGGEQWRPLVCVKDIPGYIEESIRENITGTFILSERNVTMKMLGEEIVQIFPDTKINYTDILFEDARNYHVDNSRSKQYFTYKAKNRLIEEMLQLAGIFKENRLKNVFDNIYHNGNYLKNIY